MSRIQWISVVGMAALVAACAQPEREAPSRMPVEEGRVAELAELGDAAGKQEAARELIADRMAMSPQAAGKQHQAPMRSAIAPAPMPPVHRPAPVSPDERERYAAFDDAGVLRVAEAPVSTFSVDVDTGAYSNLSLIHI